MKKQFLVLAVLFFFAMASIAQVSPENTYSIQDDTTVFRRNIPVNTAITNQQNGNLYVSLTHIPGVVTLANAIANNYVKQIGRLADGTEEGQLLFWDAIAHEWKYSDKDQLRWKTDSSKLVAHHIEADSVSIGTANKYEALTVLGKFSLRDNGSSVYIGFNAGEDDPGTYANNNIGIGTQSLNKVLAGGKENVAIGQYSLLSLLSGDCNTAVGTAALFKNTGGYNTAFGRRALYLNVAGTKNTAVGEEALNSNTNASYNTAMGYQSAFSNTIGHSNVAFGYEALRFNIAGDDNVAIGRNAIRGVDLAQEVVAIGSNAGTQIKDLSDNDTASYSIYIGQNSKAKFDSGENEIVIGHDAIGEGSNTVVIGDTTITDTYLKGYIHAPTFKLKPLTTSPDLPENGTLFFSDTDQQLHLYSNGAWHSLNMTLD